MEVLEGSLFPQGEVESSTNKDDASSAHLHRPDADRRDHSTVMDNAKASSARSSDPDELFTAKTIRKRRYTSFDWDKIKPLFTQYYIDQNMPLREVVRRISEQRDFHATEAMYKKRIHIWGIAKTMRAAEKEMLISSGPDCSGSVSETATDVTSRIDKAVRYARAEARKRPNNQTFLQKATQLRRVSAFIEALSIPSLVPHGEMADTEKLFLAHQRMLTMKSVLAWDHTYQLDLEIGSNISTAIKEWSVNAFSQSRKHFGNAGAKLRELLRVSVDAPPSPVMLTWTDPTKWTRCMPVYTRFRRFLLAVTTQTLGSHHAFTMAMRLMVELPWNAYRGLAVSDWYSASIAVTSAQDCYPWYMSNLYCIQYTLRNGLADAATRMIKKVVALLDAHSALSVDRRLILDIALAEACYQQGRYQESLEILERVMHNDSVQDTTDVDLHSAEELAAIITEHHVVDLERTKSYYVKSFQAFVKKKGATNIDTVCALADLLKFCKRHELDPGIVLPKVEWAESHSHLNLMTDGLWDVVPDSLAVDAEARRQPYADSLVC